MPTKGGAGKDNEVYVPKLNVNDAYELPTTDGTVGQVLQTDGAGTVTFEDALGGGNVSTTGTPVSGDYAKFTDATHIEGRDSTEVKTDLGFLSSAGDTMTGDLDFTSKGVSTADYVKYKTGLANPLHAEGLSFYDDAKGCLSYYNDEADVTVNMGQEVLIPVYNNSGSDIANGKVVYPTGVDIATGRVTIGLADSTVKNKCRLVGMATHSIENGTTGYVTRLGEVGGLVTTGLSGILYLTTDGDYSMTPPDDGAFVVIIGAVGKVSGTDGTIIIDPTIADITVEVTDTNGFPSAQRTNTSIAFDDGNLRFTISASSYPYHYYQIGDKYEKSTQETIDIPDVTGLYAIYYDGDTLSYTADPTSGEIDVIIRTKVLVAYVYWNAADSAHYYLGDERHGISMGPNTHTYLHFTRGAQYLSGLALADFTTGTGALDADAQFSTASGFIADEDLIHIISSTTSTEGLRIYYKTGAPAVWRYVTQTGFSVYNTGSVSGRLFFNEWTGATWQLTEVTANNKFILCHVFATSDTNGKMVSIMGEAEYLNVTAARSGVNTEINDILTSGFPSGEYIPVASIIFKTNSTYGNTIKAYTALTDTGEDYVDWRTTERSPGAGVSSHSNLSNLLNDDHSQYALLAGRTGGQTLTGSDTTAEDLTLEDNSIDGNTITVSQIIAKQDALWVIQIVVSDPNGADLTTGDGKAYFRINSLFNAWNISAVAAHVTTASSSGLITIQIHNVTDAVDLLSTLLTIDANEKDSATATTPAVINTANDDVSTADEWRIDVDGAGTGTKGLIVEVTLTKP